MAEVDLGLSLYDFNKQGMAQEKPLDAINLNRQVMNMVRDIATRSKYWMLLCRERNDYTIFIILTVKGTCNELIPTLTNRGEILSIDKQKDGNYEIWIRDTLTQENFAYYLFDYTSGIIEA
jgi:hypothetical protein